MPLGEQRWLACMKSVQPLVGEVGRGAEPFPVCGRCGPAHWLAAGKKVEVMPDGHHEDSATEMEEV